MDFSIDVNRVYRAFFGTSDDEYYVLNNCGLGIYGSHPTCSTLFITDLEISLLEPQTTYSVDNSAAALWEIAVKYGPWNPLEYPTNGNPISLPLKFRMDFTTREVAALVDVDGNPIVNAAGDPYDPPLMREIVNCTLYVDRNENPSTINLNTLSELSNSLNAATWNGFPPQTVRLAPLKIPDIKYSQSTNTFYLPMTYQFDINIDTWVKQIVNAGFRQLDSSGNLIPILLNGQPVSTPVPLDESGHAILTPGSKDAGGNTPEASATGGYSGEAAGGSQVPEGGTGAIGTAEGSPNIVIDAYLLNRTADFTVLNMNTIFTLPTP